MFRYPGGKGKLKKLIISAIKKYYNKYNCYDDIAYCEPFFGAGAIALSLLKTAKDLKFIAMNDADPGIAHLWTSVINQPEILCQLVEQFNPSTDKFFEFKNYLTSNQFPSGTSPSEIGFMKLAIHQISYSGLGTMSGGPLGGKEQKSKYDIACRWNPDLIKDKIRTIHRLMTYQRSVFLNKCSNCDFEEVIDRLSGKAIFYLDPPYYEKGPELYQYSFKHKDHIRLAKSLCGRTVDNKLVPWVLSYDNSEFIYKLYKDYCFIKEVEVSCTINTNKGSQVKTELLIVPKELKWMLEDEFKDTIDWD